MAPRYAEEKCWNWRPGFEGTRVAPIRDLMGGGALTEVSAGRATEPIDFADEMIRAMPITPRYAIAEHRGDQARKVRLVDDFRASAVSAIVAADDTGNRDVFRGRFVFRTSFDR